MSFVTESKANLHGRVQDVSHGRPCVPAAPYVAALRPYPTVGQEALRLTDPGAAMKLDWNEATLSPPAAVIEAVSNFLHNRPMQWYPDVAATRLTEALSAYCDVPGENILTFNGSDAALEYVCRTYVEPGSRVVMVSPTYDNFRVYAQGCGAQIERFHYQDPMNADLNELDELPVDARLVYLVSPNNPTGTLYPNDVLRRLLSAHPYTLFVVDEAYYEFADTTAMPLVTEFPNLLVSRTFSKAFGLAGFRIGYVAAHHTVIDMLNRIRVGKSVNALAQVAAVAALESVQSTRDYVADVRWGMNIMEKGFSELGFQCFSTPGNFVVVRCSAPDQLVASLREENVYIRNLGHLPGLAGCVRITVGTGVQCHEFLKVLRGVLRRQSEIRGIDAVSVP